MLEESAARVAGSYGTLPDADCEFYGAAVERERNGNGVDRELVGPGGAGAHNACGADELAVGIKLGGRVDVADVDAEGLRSGRELDAQPVPGVARKAAIALLDHIFPVCKRGHEESSKVGEAQLGSSPGWKRHAESIVVTLCDGREASKVCAGSGATNASSVAGLTNSSRTTALRMEASDR